MFLESLLHYKYKKGKRKRPTDPTSEVILLLFFFTLPYYTSHIDVIACTDLEVMEPKNINIHGWMIVLIYLNTYINNEPFTNTMVLIEIQTFYTYFLALSPFPKTPKIGSPTPCCHGKCAIFKNHFSVLPSCEPKRQWPHKPEGQQFQWPPLCITLQATYKCL